MTSWPPGEPESVLIDLAPANRNALLGAAVVGAVFGVAPLLALLGELAAGNGAPAAAVVLVVVICGPLAVLAVAMANAWVKAVRRGSDWLAVEVDGLRRDANRDGFAVPWSALAGIEVVATEAIGGDNPYRGYVNRRRRAGGLTALRFYPRDPATFAASYPALDARRRPDLPRRLIGSDFGLVVPMESPQRAELVDGLQRFAGPLFRGVRDETTAGRRAAG